MEDKLKDLLTIRSITGIIIGFILFIVLWSALFLNWYKVKPDEYVVVKQFGEIKKIVDKPGPQFKVPMLQTTESYPKKQLIYNVEQAEINTKDKKRMLIDNFAIWKITDLKTMIRNVKTVENAESKMGEIIYSIVREEFGSLKYDQIISDEGSGRGELAEIVTKKVNEQLKAGNYGIEVVMVAVKRTDLPTENEQSVYTRMISERQSTAQEYLSKGDANKNKIMAETDKTVTELISKAKSDAELIKAEGESQAAKIYNETYSKDPEFYKLYRTLESYKTVINEETFIMIPSDSEYAKMLTGQK